MIATRGGLQRPTWRQEDFDAEMLEASLREQRQPVSADRARQARETLPESTQAAMSALIAEHGPRARQHLAYQALGAWTPEQRESIRTLAAATPEVRAQAFSDGAASTAGFGDATEPPPRGPPPRPNPRATPVTPRMCRRGRGRPRRPANAQNGATKPREAQDQPPSSEGDR